MSRTTGSRPWRNRMSPRFDTYSRTGRTLRAGCASRAGRDGNSPPAVGRGRNNRIAGVPGHLPPSPPLAPRFRIAYLGVRRMREAWAALRSMRLGEVSGHVRASLQKRRHATMPNGIVDSTPVCCPKRSGRCSRGASPRWRTTALAAIRERSATRRAATTPIRRMAQLGLVAPGRQPGRRPGACRRTRADDPSRVRCELVGRAHRGQVRATAAAAR